jgi:hypothetical protein
MSRIAVKQTIVAPTVQAGQIIGPTVTTGTVSTATLTTNSLYLEFDTGLIPDTATLILALNDVFTFLQSSGSLVDD